MRAVLAVLLILAGVYAAQAFGLGQGNRFGRLGAMSKGAATTPVVGCVSPTAPNGVVDLSQCSNAYYVALIF